MEKTEMPSQSPMELPKSLNRETRGTLATLLVTWAVGLKLSATTLYPSKYFLSLEVSLILLVAVTVMEVQDLGQKEK